MFGKNIKLILLALTLFFQLSLPSFSMQEQDDYFSADPNKRISKKLKDLDLSSEEDKSSSSSSDSEDDTPELNGKFVTVQDSPTYPKKSISILYNRSSGVPNHHLMIEEINKGVEDLNNWNSRKYGNTYNEETSTIYFYDTFSFLYFTLDKSFLDEISKTLEKYKNITGIYVSSCHFPTKNMKKTMKDTEQFKSRTLHILPDCTEGKKREKIGKPIIYNKN